MKLEYDVTVEDVIAFNRIHLSRSPAYQRMIWTIVIVIGVQFSAIVLAIPRGESVRPLFVLAGTIGFYALFSIVIFRFLPRANDWQVRKFLKEGGNKGGVGRLEIDEQGLVERSLRQ